MRCHHDRSKNGLGVHRSPRPPSHEESPPLAPAAMAAVLDDCLNAFGRRLDLVFRRDRLALIWRRYALRRLRRQRIGGSRDGGVVSPDQEGQQKKTPVPTGIALLGEYSPTRPVFFPLGTRDERFRHRHPLVHPLSAIASGLARPIGEHRRIASNSGHAFRERRSSGITAGSRIRIRGLLVNSVASAVGVTGKKVFSAFLCALCVKSLRLCPSFRLSRNPLENPRRAHSPADAHRDHSVARFAPFQFA
jgi:hypothetical protein